MKKVSYLLALSLTLSAPGVHAVDRCEAVFVMDKGTPYEIREVMDVSRTERALTYAAQPTTKKDILQSIAYAKEHYLKITIKGTNHSHGGHNRLLHGPDGKPRAIQLDMAGFNKILKLDTNAMEVTVEPGVTWKDLSIVLNDHGLAAMTEQSSNIFSIGGSVATNIHGRDVHGPLSNSIREIKFIDPQGIEQAASRNKNPELFRALIGGYGALGIITEVRLKVEKNHLYQATSTQNITVSNYVEFLKSLANKPEEIMHYGRVNISGKNAFSKVSFVEWTPISSEAKSPIWSGWKLDLAEKNRWASSMIMNLMRHRPTSAFGKMVKDYMDKFFGLPKTGTQKTKNNILNNPVQFLFDNFYNQKKSVDILQEYFLPIEKLEPFLLSLKETTNKHQLDLMNVTMRYVPKVDRQNDGILTPYSDNKDLVAVVLYFNVKEKPNLDNGALVSYDGSLWTRELIQSAQNLGGTFYWPYHRWWGRDQITHEQKENIAEFFRIKDKLDPENIFESDFLVHLRAKAK